VIPRGASDRDGNATRGMGRITAQSRPHPGEAMPPQVLPTAIGSQRRGVFAPNGGQSSTGEITLSPQTMSVCAPAWSSQLSSFCSRPHVRAAGAVPMRRRRPPQRDPPPGPWPEPRGNSTAIGPPSVQPPQRFPASARHLPSQLRASSGDRRAATSSPARTWHTANPSRSGLDRRHWSRALEPVGPKIPQSFGCFPRSPASA